MVRPKRISFALITILLSTTLTFFGLNLFTNIFALALFQEDVYPRGWNNYTGMFYRTLGVQAHDGRLASWTAILGDSYAEGAGDAYLNGRASHTIAHFLHDRNHANYLIFGRSGFGSISAVREFEIAKKEFSDALFLPELGPPDEIILLFYEGNDLADNLRYIDTRYVQDSPLDEFVRSEIQRSSDVRRKIDFYLPLVRPTYMLAKDLILAPFRNGQSEKAASTDNRRLPQYTTNSLIVSNGDPTRQTVIVEDRVQGAAVELTQESIDLALNVFFLCLDYLSERYPYVDITIVYIPSPITIYDWNDPVNVMTLTDPDGITSNKRLNDTNSAYIRGQISTYMDRKSIDFVDTTEALRAKSVLNLLHGPRDWNHFNGVGYEFVSTLIYNIEDTVAKDDGRESSASFVAPR
jgi:hypothetical protein